MKHGKTKIRYYLLAPALIPFLMGMGAQLLQEIRLADGLFAQGNYEAARDSYLKIIEQDRNIAEVWYNLGNAYFRLAKADLEGETPKTDSAEISLRKALEAYSHLSIDRSDSPELKADAEYNAGNCRVLLGGTQMSSGKIQDATANFETAVDDYLDYLIRNPEAEDARHNIEVAQGLNAKAHQIYVAILSYTPTSTPTITPIPTITDTPTPAGTPSPSATPSETPLTPNPTPTPEDTPTATATGTQQTQTQGASPTAGRTPKENDKNDQQEQKEEKKEEEMSRQEIESFLDNLNEELIQQFEVQRPVKERDW